MNGSPKISDEFRELIELFLSHRVEFMVVGAHALAAYGRPRFTEDIDLFIERSIENAERVGRALRDFGVGIEASATDQLANDPRAMIALGVKPMQIDILNFLDGVDFADAKERIKLRQFGNLEAPVIGVQDFIASKQATGRPQDLADIEVVKRIQFED